ncbi:hypothetical protein ARMSODRAFT_956933 [Armillaria solidipes]|uniref:Uncharacterized protein n=1 Tax=Armillaria solidipes TaxID=1076256 RepID=A0A2H3BI60_9AGAR|nr:hypothetical protein ARMSODRAFT_956933 [Armillaria solidipes]
MSLVRASLTLFQAVAHHFAMTPPNPTPNKGRYHTEELYILQIAPLIFWLHSVALWIFAVFETLLYLTTVYPAEKMSSYASLAVCPAASSPSTLPHLVPTTLFYAGCASIFTGTLIRLDCFHTLGELFTFDLTVHPAHKLVKTRLYGVVRHPAYTGSLMLVAGIALAHFTRGGWAAECVFNDQSGWGMIGMYVLWGVWWIWTSSVGISRALAEDKQMRLLFGDEWERYARDVRWWFIPWLL